jgi:hypothetical protein
MYAFAPLSGITSFDASLDVLLVSVLLLNVFLPVGSLGSWVLFAVVLVVVDVDVRVWRSTEWKG